MSATAPSGAADIIRIVGYAVDSSTILFDPELMRFHAAWEGGLASFARGRGGLEGTIKNDGDVFVSTGWSTGIGMGLCVDGRVLRGKNADHMGRMAAPATGSRHRSAEPLRPVARRAAETSNQQEERGVPACLLVPDLIRAPLARLLRRAAPRASRNG